MYYIHYGTGNLKLLRVITLIPAYVADYNLYQPSVKPSSHKKKLRNGDSRLVFIYYILAFGWIILFSNDVCLEAKNIWMALRRQMTSYIGRYDPLKAWLQEVVWIFEDFASCCRHATSSNSHSCRKIHFNLQSLQTENIFLVTMVCGSGGHCAGANFSYLAHSTKFVPGKASKLLLQ